MDDRQNIVKKETFNIKWINKISKSDLLLKAEGKIARIQNISLKASKMQNTLISNVTQKRPTFICRHIHTCLYSANMENKHKTDVFLYMHICV